MMDFTSARGAIGMLAGNSALSKWWSTRLLGALLLAGLAAVPASGRAQGRTGTQGGGSLPAVSLDGNYFSAQGHRFVVVGANWVPAKAGMLWPVHWDPQAVEADFAKMAQMGFNTVRLDLVWGWFEPRPGYYNREAFAQFDYLIKLAHKYRIYLNPILFTGGEVGEAWWDVPWRMGRDPQSDPLMLYLETNLAQEFGRRYAHEAAILAWDLADEPPFWISRNTTDAMAANWTRLIVGGIRKYDKVHPIVVGTSTEDFTHGPFRPDTIADDVDFFSTHPYTIYTNSLFPDPMVSERGTYGAAFATALNLGAGKPVLMQELGASSAQYSPQKITEFERTSNYSALAAGNNGFLPWCFTDAAPEQYHKVPYLRSPHETQFGLTTWDGKVKPRGVAFEKFGKIVARMNLDGISLPRGDAAIVIPEEWSVTRGNHADFGLTGGPNIPYVSVTEGGAVDGAPPKPYQDNQWVMSSVLSSFILAHRAGWNPALPREQGDWSQYPIILLPSPLTATDPIGVHLHTDFWAKVRAYVRNGGVLYASLSANAAIPEMADLFGARMTDSQPVHELTLKIVKPFGTLQPGDEFHFSVPGSEMKYWGTGLQVGSGEVIAVDQEGRPALVSHKLGSGRTLLSAYPLEAYLGSTVGAFDHAPTNYRLYRALRAWSGIEPLVSTDQPEVEAGALVGQRRGYLVLVNHGEQPQQVHLSTTLAAHQLKLLGTDGETPVSREQGRWNVEVPAYDGVILEWNR
jgi:endo-1,4-beta-mannosidase